MGQPDPVARARRHLYRKQARWAQSVPPSAGPSPMDVARQRLATRAAQPQSDGFVWDGAFRYPIERESVRWSRTRHVIERTRPGPHEDGNYLEFLARQAASVELTIEAMLPDEHTAASLDKIIFGTTGEPTSQATTSWMDGASVIALSAGMVYLMYQGAKSVVLSWKQVPREDGRGGVAFSSRIEDISSVLEQDDRPVRLLTDTLLAWIYTGLARPADSVAPPQQYHPPLALLTSGAERFVLGHEYGHALVDQFHLPVPWVAQDGELTDIEEELRADAFATVVVAESAPRWDSMAPNMLLQGGILAMKIHEIADRVRDLARGGDGDPEWNSTTHPPFDERARQLIEIYEAIVHGTTDHRLDVRPLFLPAETAEMVWELARPRILQALSNGRPIHPSWKESSRR